ncbi:putative mitochondrial chaperone BCS1-B [Leucoagaricus sp. SymC.cos]|nr:putative mitochondrial chaperone BCS1-B [Leucoagaricus sp. SymC.cos]
MAAPALLVQSVLSALVGNPGVTPQIQCNTQTGNATESSGFPTGAAVPSPGFTNIPALITSLLSISALRDWLKLFIIGGAFEFCRRVGMKAYHAVYDWFFITAVFMEDDASYDWIMVWLSKQPSWTNARDVQISTRSFGLRSNAVLIPGEEDDDSSATVSGERPLAYIPSYSSRHTFWYNRRWCRVSRLQKDGAQWYKTKEEYLELCILSWDQRILNELLLEAKKAYKAAQENSISVYVSDPNHGWRHVTTRPKRPLSSIVLDPGMKDLLVEDAQDFLESKNWYSVRGIPFRRGYLLHGAPGSGKTSIIHSLAGELGLDIYIVSLSRSGLDDNALNEIISDLPEKCIALMEDIDAAFTTPLNRNIVEKGNDSASDPHTSQAQARQQQEERVSKITLSGLLNALDGVAAQEGRLLFATTNRYQSLDPALTRPGRMDLHIEFKLASKYQARELYRCFFLPDSELLAEAEARSKSPSRDGSEADTNKAERTEKVSLLEVEETASNTSETSTAVASTLPDALPEREFSMASLQGYLMTYKTRPMEAAGADGAKELNKEVANTLSTLVPATAAST